MRRPSIGTPARRRRSARASIRLLRRVRRLRAGPAAPGVDRGAHPRDPPARLRVRSPWTNPRACLHEELYITLVTYASGVHTAVDPGARARTGGARSGGPRCAQRGNACNEPGRTVREPSLPEAAASKGACHRPEDVGRPGNAAGERCRYDAVPIWMTTEPPCGKRRCVRIPGKVHDKLKTAARKCRNLIGEIAARSTVAVRPGAGDVAALLERIRRRHVAVRSLDLSEATLRKLRDDGRP